MKANGVAVYYRSQQIELFRRQMMGMWKINKTKDHFMKANPYSALPHTNFVSEKFQWNIK